MDIGTKPSPALILLSVDPNIVFLPLIQYFLHMWHVTIHLSPMQQKDVAEISAICSCMCEEVGLLPSILLS